MAIYDIKTTKSVYVTTSFEGIHNYPNAPDAVSFLAHPHRHIFHVKVSLEVFHDDRELEFILVKRDLDKELTHRYSEESKSCEMIAEELCYYMMERWPVPDHALPFRSVEVEVSEDKENGATVKKYREEVHGF